MVRAAVAVALMMDGTWRGEREKRKDSPRLATATECANKRETQGEILTAVALLGVGKRGK